MIPKTIKPILPNLDLTANKIQTPVKGMFTDMKSIGSVDLSNRTLSPKEFTEKYIQSPIYKKRMELSGYEDLEKNRQTRLKAVQESNTIIQEKTPSIAKQISNELNGIPYSNSGSNAVTPKYVIVDKSEAKKYNVPVSSIETHEYSHKETGIDKDLLNNNDIMQLQDRLRPTIRDEHDIDPTENKADMNALRYELYKSGVDVFNGKIEQKHLDMIRNSKSSGGKRLLKNYEDKDALWLLNNVAQNKQNNNEILNV